MFVARRWAPALALVLLGTSCGGGEQPQSSEDGGAGPAGGPPSEAVELAAGEPTPSSPAIAIDGDGVIHVAWTVGAASDAQIRHRYLVPGGDWSESATVTTGFQYNGAPRLVVEPTGEDCLFWTATVPEAGLYVRCWSDGR
jgi:hypothetical protein